MTATAAAGSPTYDAVVIGSGFAGSIAALRLAEAGRRVCVVERGRSYEDHDFPRDPFDAPRLLWRHPARRSWTGLFDLRFHSGIATLTAAGLGGGSLVYANVLVRPDARVFDERWPTGVDRAGLDPFYGMVEAELRPSPVPDPRSLPKNVAMDRAVERLGRTDAMLRPPLAVDWNACRLVAECEFGCRFGAKRSLDATYLAKARTLGAEIRTGLRAITVEPAPGGYRVSLASVPDRRRSTLTARVVVLAAGTLGTTELLLRARDQHRTLPRLSSRLGERFSGNGDFIGAIVGTPGPIDPSHGPDVTAVLRAFDAGPGITIATPTFSTPVMDVVARAAGAGPVPLGPLGRLLWPAANGLVDALLGTRLGSSLLRGTLGGPPDDARLGAARHATAVFAIGRDSATGRMVLRRGRNGPAFDVAWDYRRTDAALLARQWRLLSELADAYGGRLVASPTWALAGRSVTVHPLGGAIMGSSADDGVVSPLGEVHRHPGLFVSDASAIPSAIGFHPALTISANAERIAAAVVSSL